MISLLESHNLSGATVEMHGMLHLKTGLSCLENNTFAGCNEILHEPEFAKFNHIADDAYAANCVWVNGTVLVAAGFPKTRKKIEAAPYPVIPVDVSKFLKLDGGLSCLSLRF